MRARAKLCLGILTFWWTLNLHAKNLVIISSHRKSIQDEFMELFKSRHPDVQWDWIDQGGSENSLRYVYTQYERNKASSQIDIFWGGGDLSFIELENRGLLQPLNLNPALKTQLPTAVLGVNFFNKSNTWVASALSSFGIFYNKPLLQLKSKQWKLATPFEPKHWQDLANPQLFNLVSVSDPRQSSSSLLMSLLVLNSLGWEEGWKTLTAIAANVKQFPLSSSDPLKHVVNGEVAVATSVDFYAAAKLAELGDKKVGFVLPEEQTIVNADPIAILKGAPNPLEAQQFVDFVLDKDIQKLLIQKKDIAGKNFSPKHNTLGRMAVNPLAYQDIPAAQLAAPNPFTMQAPKFKFDFDNFVTIKVVFGDLLGAVLINPHHQLKEAWNKAIKQNSTKALLQVLAKPYMTEKEFWDLSKKWHDQVFRNRTIDQWTKEAMRRYAQETQSTLNKTTV